MKVDELVKRAKSKNADNEYWLQLEKDMLEFLNSDAPKSEKRKLAPLGWFESVTIICDGIRRKNG